MSELNSSCKICDKKFHIKPCQIKRGRGKYCSIKCRAKAQSIRMTGIKNKKYGSPGKLNPNWQGGLSTRGYPRNWSSVLKELIRRRDNYKCKLCGTPQEESIRKLPVHHIDYDKNNLKHSNLVTLCSKCNPKVNYNRKYWQKYFTEEVMPHECQA